jgi:hypothetical protein
MLTYTSHILIHILNKPHSLQIIMSCNILAFCICNLLAVNKLSQKELEIVPNKWCSLLQINA